MSENRTAKNAKNASENKSSNCSNSTNASENKSSRNAGSNEATNGKKSSDDMSAWISTDSRRIPLRIEGKLPVGKIHILYDGR